MITNAIVADINSILQSYGIGEVVRPDDITVTARTVTDMAKKVAKLSDAIINHLWSSVPSATVYHYTSRDAAESILSTGIFRLSNIEKRLNDGEVKTFCKTHDLHGYLEDDENGIPRYRSLLMPQLFYASFTDLSATEDEEKYFWRNFASNDGVRLKLEVAATNPNFRRIAYEQNPGEPIPLLRDLVAAIRNNHHREFVLQGISRLCAFYLQGQRYGREKELRALFKVWPDSSAQPVGAGPNSYVEVPLGQPSATGYRLSIAEVHAFTRPQMPSHYTFDQRV